MSSWHLRKYAPGFAAESVILQPLTSKSQDVKFVWTLECKAAFREIKSMCGMKLRNTHLDSKKVQFLVTDASGTDSICALIFQCEAKALVGGVLSPRNVTWSHASREPFLLLSETMLLWNRRCWLAVLVFQKTVTSVASAEAALVH